MKLFTTSDMQTVRECQSIFDFRLPRVIILLIPDRCKTFRVINCYRAYPVPAVISAAFVLLMHHKLLTVHFVNYTSDCLIILAYLLYFGVHCVLLFLFVFFLSITW